MAELHEREDEQSDTTNDVDIASVGLVAFVGFVLLFASVVWLQSYYYRTEEETQRRADSGTPAQLALIRSQQQSQLTGDGGKLPIEQAMEWVVKETAHGGSR